jgi:hypothetical protein
MPFKERRFETAVVFGSAVVNRRLQVFQSY